MKSSLIRTCLVVLLAGLALAACTRSVNPTSLPPATKTASGLAGGAETSGAPDSELATMNAVGTKTAKDTTATAVGGLGGKTTPLAPEVTATPAAPGDATAAPATAAPTETPQAPPLPTAGSVPPVNAACPNPYTVKDGDWIFKIAHDCQVEPSAIIAANPGINPNRITPGQKLNMPSAGATAVPPATPQAQACKGSYTVKGGDNLFRIAYNCGLTTEQLAAINAIAFPYTIYPGQIIKFP